MRWRRAIAGTVAAIVLWTPAAAASPQDAASTHRFLIAAVRVLSATVTHQRQEKAAGDALVGRVASGCPHVLRSAQQSAAPVQMKTLSWLLAAANDVLILDEVEPLRRSYGAFARGISPLRWSSRPLSRQVEDMARHVRGLAALRPVDLCREAEIARGANFRRIPPAILTFVRHYAVLTSSSSPTPAKLAARMKHLADPGNLATIARVHALDRRADAVLSRLTTSADDRLGRALLG